jgi:putative intracellular protease/amidase
MVGRVYEVNPDGAARGEALGVYYVLRDLGHACDLLVLVADPRLDDSEGVLLAAVNTAWLSSRCKRLL